MNKRIQQARNNYTSIIAIMFILGPFNGWDYCPEQIA